MTTSPNLSVLTRFEGAMGQALARRGHALLESPTLQTEAAALGTSELFFMVKEMGVDEGLPLIQAAGPGRLQSLCDLDCWEGDGFEPLELDVWLAPFAAEGKEALAEAFLGLDEELQVLFLQATLEAIEHQGDDPPEVPNNRRTKELPGSLFTLVAKDIEGEVDPFVLVDAIMAHSMEEVFRLLTAVNWELASTLEGEAHRFREARLMDLGFVPGMDSAKLFAPPPRTLPQHLVGAAHPQAMPAIYAQALMGDEALLNRALGGLRDEADVRRIETELVYLINAGVSGWDLTVRSLTDMRDVALFVRNVLSLGLELLHGQADPTAPELENMTQSVRTVPLLHLFQTGMAEILKLARVTQRLVRRPEVAEWLETSLPPEDDPEGSDRAFVRGLSRTRPLWLGAQVADVRQRRMWQSRAELAHSAKRLQQIALRWPIEGPQAPEGP